MTKEDLSTEKFMTDYLNSYGYENWDLLLTVMDSVRKDLSDYWGNLGIKGYVSDSNPEFLLPLFRLFGELVISDRNLIMAYLPKGHTSYEDKYVGGLRD